MEIQQLLSKYMLEISKVTNEETLYSAFSGILRKVIEINVLNVLRSEKVVYCEPLGEYIENELFSDYIPWVEERLYPTFLPLENGYIGLIPIFKARKSLATIVIKTNNEPTAEVIDYVQLLAYLSGITLENLRLLDFVDRAREYFESIINLSNDGILILNNVNELEFINNKARETIEKLPKVLDMILNHINMQENFFEIEENNLFFSVSTKEVELLGEQKILVNVRNVTSEKEVQKLKEVDKIKTNFIANISHELRTPLAAIKAYVETILNMPMSQEEIQDFLNIVYGQSLRLEELLNDLLDFSQLESHTMKIIKEPFKICEIVVNAMTTVSKMAEDKGVEIKYDCQDTTISCDKRRVEQVFVNLLTNAIKFSDPSKTEKYVNIQISDELNNVRIVVEDNGIGIPRDKLDKIFEKFYRVDNELTYSAPGTGLGLSIVKEIVELHGGKIEVYSELGKYTKFIVILPKE
ncbi:MAG: HAMP domain-containing sensor histidine kinase [Fervidobacterium sp.]